MDRLITAGARVRRPSKVVLATAALMVLVACGSEQKDASQVAARVNDKDITVHQVNFALQQQGQIPPDELDARSRKVLDQLIDQEIAVQKATELELDRDPRVVQAMQAARRQVLARAYLERIVRDVTKPTPEALRKFYDDNPALFSQRRIYNLQEIVTRIPDAQAADFKTEVAQAQGANAVADWLKQHNIPFRGNQATRPAEQLPMGILAQLAALPDGRGIVMSDDAGTRVVFRASSQLAPVQYEAAVPAIERFVLSQERRDTSESNIKALRASAKIDLMGKFAQAPSEPSPAATAQPAATPAQAPLEYASQALSVPELEIPDTPLPGASGAEIDPDTVKKGLGFK